MRFACRLSAMVGIVVLSLAKLPASQGDYRAVILGDGQAYGINNRGEVAGFATAVGQPTLRAVVWREGGSLDLGIGVALGINDESRVVGRRPVDGCAEAVVWTATQVLPLPHLSTDVCQSAASAINNRGQIVGWSALDNGRTHAVLWEDGRVTDLGVRSDAPVDSDSFAYDINERGDVVGQGMNEQGPIAFLWMQGQMTYVGEPMTSTPGEFIGINNRGMTTGYLEVPGTSSVAILWRNGQVLNLTAPSHAVGSKINERGTVAGQRSSQATLWGSSGLTVLPMAPGAIGCAALGLNDRDDAVGYCTIREAGSQSDVAVLWTRRPPGS